MVYKKKTWQEKLENKDGLPKILKLQKNFPCYNAVHKMGVEEGEDIVLVNPSEIVEIMKKVPQKKLITIVEICKNIAKKHKVKGCCSLTKGIFIMTAANAEQEAKNNGKTLGIPYWRTLKTDGYLNEKYPNGIVGHKKILEQEGFTVIKKGNKFFVENHKEYFMEI